MLVIGKMSTRNLTKSQTSKLTSFCDKHSQPVLLTNSTTTECVTDLNYQNEMIIFESLLTTFEAKIIFEATEAVTKIGLTNFSLSSGKKFTFR